MRIDSKRKTNSNKVMKANAPEKIYFSQLEDGRQYFTPAIPFEREFVEYMPVDAFIKKARKWFEMQTEWTDPNGNRHCDMESFEDFRKYMKGE